MNMIKVISAGVCALAFSWVACGMEKPYVEMEEPPVEMEEPAVEMKLKGSFGYLERYIIQLQKKQDAFETYVTQRFDELAVRLDRLMPTASTEASLVPQMVTLTEQVRQLEQRKQDLESQIRALKDHANDTH